MWIMDYWRLTKNSASDECTSYLQNERTKVGKREIDIPTNGFLQVGLFNASLSRLCIKLYITLHPFTYVQANHQDQPVLLDGLLLHTAESGFALVK